MSPGPRTAPTDMREEIALARGSLGMLLIELLTPATRALLDMRLRTLAAPPNIDDPKTFAAAATAGVGSEAPSVDRWRLVVILASFEGLISPQDAADVCIGIGNPPTIEAASEALEAFAPSAKAVIIEALAEIT